MKELIIRGGANISPFEIDEILMHIPGVKAGVAVGFQNDWYGEEVGAYVVLQEGSSLTEADILVRCRRHLPFAKSPKVVVFGTEVPVTSTGKYQRVKCERLFRDVEGASIQRQAVTPRIRTSRRDPAFSMDPFPLTEPGTPARSYSPSSVHDGAIIRT